MNVANTPHTQFANKRFAEMKQSNMKVKSLHTEQSFVRIRERFSSLVLWIDCNGWPNTIIVHIRRAEKVL